MGERVWERFLTEQDKEHLAGGTKKRVGFGEKPALLLIDLYQGVFGDRPQPLLEAIRTYPSSCGMAAWDSLPHIETLLHAARAAEIPVIHITGISEYEQGVAGWHDRIHPGNGKRHLTPEEEERKRHQFDIVDELTPITGEAVLRKSAPSAFWGTPLGAHLRHLGIDTVITCGESTSGCVRASVVEGATHAFHMVVVEECVFDRHQAAHALNLFDMDQKYADVLSLGEVLEYMAGWKANNQAVAS